MTRNKSNLLCARAHRNRTKTKETSILSSEQEMKARLIFMTQEQSSSHPSGRFIFLPSKRVEADETDFKGMVRQFFRRSFFPSVPAFELTVLYRSTKSSYGSCREKIPDKWHTQYWLLCHDNTPCHTDLQLFQVPNQKKMVVVSGLCISPS